jgi:hypothetical protein
MLNYINMKLFVGGGEIGLLGNRYKDKRVKEDCGHYPG